MSLVQPPPDAADEDPVLREEGRVIDLPAGALSSRRTARGRTTPNSRARRPVNGVDLGAALDASLADVSAAAEKLAGAGGVTPAAPGPAGPRPAPAAPQPAPRPRAVPRPPAWQPVPWSEASARAEGRPAAPGLERRPMPQAPAAAAQMPRRQPPVRTAITVPFPAQRAHHRVHDEPARLRGVDVDPSMRTIPAWLLAVMVVVVAGVACLAAYLLLRP